ncbi:MAG: hypothetical protein WA432_01780 [Candidatus Babeliaceae bacterium]
MKCAKLFLLFLLSPLTLAPLNAATGPKKQALAVGKEVFFMEVFLWPVYG